MRRLLPAALAPLLLLACSAPPETPSARVFFEAPADGDTVQSPVHLAMGVAGMTVAPAGTFEEGTGHFHVVVDNPFVAAGSVIPSDAEHIHFGTGATEADLGLAPGEHTLRLQMADGAHIALDGMQAEITIIVVASEEAEATQ